MALENKNSPVSEQDSPDSTKSSQSTGGEQAAKPKRARGLAAASPETRKLVARRGGEAVSRNKKHMAEIGRKGGEAVSQDRKHMSDIGRKGGEAVSQNREHMAEIGRKGGEARGSHHHEEPSGSEGQGGESEGGEGSPGQSDQNK